MLSNILSCPSLVGAPCGLSQWPKEATSAIKMTAGDHGDSEDVDDGGDMLAAGGRDGG